MRKQAREALDAYYAEADSWARDNREETRQSRKLAWVIAACCASALAAVSVAVPSNSAVSRVLRMVMSFSKLSRLNGPQAMADC